MRPQVRPKMGYWLFLPPLAAHQRNLIHQLPPSGRRSWQHSGSGVSFANAMPLLRKDLSACSTNNSRDSAAQLASVRGRSWSCIPCIGVCSGF